MAQLVPIQISHPRPRQLSDPWHDFDPVGLELLLAKPDDQLAWHDLKNLLGPHLPAGTYEESVYFVPLAFEFLWAADDNRIDVAPALVGFVSQNAPQLRDKGSLDAVRSNLLALLMHWSKEFEILHLDAEDCRSRGYVCNYADYVRNSGEICNLLSEMVRFKVHQDIAIEFVRLLSNHEGDPSRAAWFLELARSRADSTLQLSGKAFDAMLRNPESLAAALAAVEERNDYRKVPTYWGDTLGLIWR